MVEISALSIVCVVASMLVSVFFPVIYLIVGKGKMKGSFLPLFGSVLVYLFILILQAVTWSLPDMDNLLLKLLGKENSDAVSTSIKCVYMALLETAGIWLYFFIVRKKRKKAGDAVVFGSGYSICACFTFSVLLVMSVIIVISNAMGHDVTLTFGRLSVNNAVLEREDIQFLYYGLRSLFDAVFYIAASVLIFTAVQNQLIWPIPVTAFLNILHILPALMNPLHVWYWGNGVVVMIALGIVAVISGLLAYRMYLGYYKQNYTGEET